MAGIANGRAGERSIAHTRVPRDESLFSQYFRNVRTLGEGSFGVVVEGERLSDGTRWAIKTLHKERAGSSQLKQLEREIQILKMISHPAIVCLEEVFESPTKMHLVLELCELGTLEQQLEKVGHYKESDAKPIMQQLANAVAYLHRNGIVHRDVKLENVLCTATEPRGRDRGRNVSVDLQPSAMFIKLTDFSISALKEPDEMIESVCGTLIYMSPEILDDRLYSQQCDVWAMGIIMYQLLCGLPPFRAKDEHALKQLIRQAALDFSASQWRSVSQFAVDCIRKLLKVDTAYRITASELLEHPWLNDAGDQRPNVIELMREFRLTQTDKGNSNSNDLHSAESSSSDLRFSDRHSSADSSKEPLKSSSANYGPKKALINGTKHSSTANVRTTSSLSDSLSTAKPRRLIDRNLSEEMDNERQRRVEAVSRDEPTLNYVAPRYVNTVNAGRRVSPQKVGKRN